MRRIGARRSLILLLMTACTGAYAAEAVVVPGESMRMLRQMAMAARSLNYAGTFVYRHGNTMETSRIWHLVDASGEHERLETLDGPPREVVRVNDDVTCYFPDAKTARIERRITARRFPAVVSEQLNAVAANYTMRLGRIDRVAGHECRVTMLEPRDALRYGHVFCNELKTGLPLRAALMNERNEALEVFAFTQIEIGAALGPEHVRSRYDANAPGWQVDRPTPSPQLDDHVSGWTVLNRPPGFRKVMEVKRTIRGRNAAQLVFSDGLAAVSIFVEPAVAGARSAQELSHQGAINLFSIPYGEYVITALGEAPAATIMQFAHSTVERRGR